MKTLLQFALLLALCNMASAQVVQACLTINGTPNNVSRTISLCPGNFELQLTNCSPTPGNASYIQYAWENVTTSQTFSEGPSNNINVNTAGMWVGTMHFNNGIKDTISRDTVTVTFHTVATLSLTLTGTSGLFNYSAPNAIKCLLSTGTFNVVPNNLVSYAWFCNTVNPNTSLSNTTSLLLNSTNSFASPYQVEAMDINGCKSTFSFNIGISSAPIISLNHQTITKDVNDKTSIILKNDLENTGTYSWYYGYPTPNTLLVSGSNINPIYLVDGYVDLIAPLDTFPLPTSDNLYAVRFTNFLCPAQDTVSVIISGTLNNFSHEEQRENIRIFPTAASDVLYWENNQDISKGVITNTIGQKILSFDMNDKKGSVNISSIPSGNYILTIQGRNGEIQHKRIVK